MAADADAVPVENPRRALATIFAIVFVDLLGFGILIPVLPLYAEHFGASGAVVGLLLASYSATQFVFAPLLGRLSDGYGRRPVLLLSLFGSVLAWTLFGLADGLLVLFVARLLAGAMGGNIATTQAYIADITPPERRAQGLGLVGAAFGLGFVFGPALGGVFSSPGVVSAVDGALPGLVPITQFTLPSFAAAVISAANLVAAFAVLPETRRTTRAAETGSRLAMLRDALEDPALAGLVASFFLFSLAFSGMESMFVLFTGDQFGFGPAMNGYVLAYVGVVIAIVQGGLVGRIVPRFGEVRIAVLGVVLTGVTIGLLPFTATLVALLAVLTPLAVGNAFANVSLTTLVSRSASADEQGGAFGLTQSAGSLARIVGPVAAGVLYTAVAYWSPFVAGAVVLVPVLLILSSRVFGRDEAAVAG